MSIFFTSLPTIRFDLSIFYPHYFHRWKFNLYEIKDMGEMTKTWWACNHIDLAFTGVTIENAGVEACMYR